MPSGLTTARWPFHLVADASLLVHSAWSSLRSLAATHGDAPRHFWKANLAQSAASSFGRRGLDCYYSPIWCACDCQLANAIIAAIIHAIGALRLMTLHAAHKQGNKVIGKNRRLPPPHIRHLVSAPSIDAFGTVATYSSYVATTDYTHTS